MLVVDQVPTDTLDHAAPVEDLGSHVGVDATRPLPGEPARAHVEPRGPTWTQVVPRGSTWALPHPRLLLVAIEKTKAGQARAAMRDLWANAGVPASTVIVVYDASVDVADWHAALFHATANLDPARDIVRDGARVGVDATVKLVEEGARAWPPIIAMDDATRRKVDARWKEYGLP